MKAFAKAYSRFAARLSLLCLVAAGIGLVAMTAIVAWTVFGRYVLNATPTWGEPASLFLMLWFILLGGAVGVRELDHMGFDVLLFHAQGKWRAALVVVNELLVAIFGGAMMLYGSQLAAKVWSDRLPMIGISKGWDYVPIIAGGTLVMLFSIEKLLLQASGERLQPMPLVSGGHRSEA
ncbi:MAG: TRAP transporter small permease [Methylobacterium sp.]|jgi:TRAP-type C4-dicarboxylate transport system permease small subunit|nr:TRAP transporter small permease [Methylobacterium sp.]